MNIIIPDKIMRIETQRLVLREIYRDDDKEIFEIFSDDEVALYDWFRPIKNLSEADTFIERYNEEFEAGEEITWGIALKETEKLIGICCLGNFDNYARRAEIGYDLMKSQWGRGYGTEAVKAVITYGFKNMNLNRIEAFITPGNTASIRLMEKSGFIKEGIVRERDFIKGKFEDGVIMSKLRRDE
ncbi:GNAT family N-acetyltransferase [Clostridium polynesiense]|uniref:GNAT family N-acetyltransferase n=1 Tax=Clostridium polynesiense TaxID=1325933 RepID=UPI000693F216|nr:GNAT family protein [Clostridium polynesiense]